jgi:RimK family alpha-L-glutamate ligase
MKLPKDYTPKIKYKLTSFKLDDMKEHLSIKSLMYEIIMKEQLKDNQIPTVLVLSSMISDSKGTIGKLKKSCEKFGLPFYAIRSKSAFIDTTQNSKKSLRIENYNGNGDVLLINPRKTICFVRGSAIKTEVGSALIHIMENYGVFAVNDYKSMQFCSNKLASMIELERRNIPIPRTAYVPSTENIDTTLKKIGGKFPVVIKTITGAEGIGVSIVDSYQSLKSVLQSLWKYDAEVIIQEYFDVKFDVRTLVLDNKIIASSKRIRGSSDFRTNLSLGNSGGPHKLTDIEKEIVLKAAKTSGAFYVAVDHLLVDGKPYVLELNGSPGSTNIYTNYYNSDGDSSTVSGQELINNVVEYISDKSNWEISVNEAGVVENVKIEEKHYEAKLDTGNSGHSSLHATDIKIEEVDGIKIVNFVDNFGKKISKPLISIVKVRTHSIYEVDARPVIEMDVNFRGLEFRRVQFNLVDRSKNTYPVLLGARFLKRARVSVNPNKTFVLPN